MKKVILIFAYSIIGLYAIKSQDLNSISGSGFNIATSFSPVNAPAITAINGFQSQYDANYKWQFVNTYPTNNYYIRSYTGVSWSNWYNIWHSGNFNPSNYLGKTVTNISSIGSANSFINGQTFAYANSGSPWNGAFLSFGGFSNEYDCQISTDYGLNGGKHISFRTKNGDSGGTWNSWYEIFHSGNFCKSDVDFTCKNLVSFGNVLIGKTTQINSAYKLDVEGSIRANEIVVNTTGADFVFEPTYKLMSLNDLDAYLKANRHLPGIAPATEMQENGVSSGEMQTKLLQKVEELTLYVIEQQKEIKELKQDNQQLKEKVNTILK